MVFQINTRVWLHKAALKYFCPHCLIEEGIWCVTPSGKRARIPHRVRYEHVTKEDAIECLCVPDNGTDDFKAALAAFYKSFNDMKAAGER